MWGTLDIDDDLISFYFFNWCTVIISIEGKRENPGEGQQVKVKD